MRKIVTHGARQAAAFAGRLILAAMVTAAWAAPCLAQSRAVALTFDDLPIAGGGGADEAQAVNRAILAALDRHHAPAVAFVNEKGIRKTGAAAGKAILREWLEKGQDLGNHTFSHGDLNNLSADQFSREVIDGEASIAEALGARGRKPAFLRFPFNHSGDTKEKHDAVAKFLAACGYTVAACTIDNSDYEFARAYEIMLARGDHPAATKLETEYVAFTGAEIDYYTQLHRKVRGREIPHVMLLHANRLNAGMMDPLLGLFEDRGYRFVTLQQAQADPAYRAPDTYVTKFGPMWGYRWAAARGIRVNGKREPQPAEWILQYGLK